MNNRLCFNLSEAAEAIGCSRKFMYEHLLNIPGFPLIRLGRKCLVPVDELKAWLSEQTEVRA